MSNREINVKLLELADFVEKSNQFDMGNWPHNCETAGCIGGHAQALFHPVRWGNTQELRDLLGISAGQAEELFLMRSMDSDIWSGYEIYGHLVTSNLAARVIRHLAVTGTVDWSLVL